MRISQIRVTNFRLLKDTTVDIEEHLSLVIGKNNTGKTSFVHIMDKFLNTKKFTFDDFNIDLCKKLIDAVTAALAEKGCNRSEYEEHKITLRLVIEYFDDSDLSHISKFIMDLDPEIKTVVLLFEYILTYEKFNSLIADFKNYLESNFDSDDSTSATEKELRSFLQKHHSHYFAVVKKSVEVSNEDNFEIMTDDDIRKVVRLETIDARRDVANTEGSAGKTLSRLSSRYYKARDTSGPNDPPSVTKLQQQLSRTDTDLTRLYAELFKPVTDSVKTFSAIAYEEAELVIQSLLSESNLFEENTYVSYQHDDYNLPENYNGLGYMNLFSIIFDIHIKLGNLKNESTERNAPADINLLFIEEPEAHTHPQMQYVFIKNIKNLLETETRDKISLQTIITTHSSHIVSQSDFEDIKYFYRASKNSAEVKNMKDLANSYRKAHAEWFDYLKKYLTLNNSELFFADKAIFIEGTTERILLPTMMRMIDKSKESDPGFFPLLSQNVSVVEVGNYAHVFDEFLKFLEIKTLVITDFDSVDETNKTCRVDKGTSTSNASIKCFLCGRSFNELKSLSHVEKILRWQDDKQSYVAHREGKLCIAFQTEECSYHARTFEDAFLACGTNLDFVIQHKSDFLSLKNIDKMSTESPDYFDIANTCIDKKSSFASDILFHTAVELNSWSIPAYIREGLEWLAK